MDTRGPRHLRQTLDARLNLFARYHHQVGHLVDDDHDVRQDLGLKLFGLKHRLACVVIKSGLNRAREHLALGQSLADAAIIPIDIAHAHFGHLAIAFFHLAHDPFQGNNRLFRVGHNRGKQVRNAVINTQFKHLGVNHDQAAFVRGQTIQKRQDHRVDRN